MDQMYEWKMFGGGAGWGRGMGKGEGLERGLGERWAEGV